VSRDWVRQVINLLDAAARDLKSHQDAQRAIFEARGLLRTQIDPPIGIAVEKGGLLPWQVRRVRAYIESHLADPVLIADLSVLVQRSEAHFARSFKRTFGLSPHAFLIRRRVELAAHYMLMTSASLSEIAVCCGFTDQPHFSKHFRQSMGQTPAAWRRARSAA
jgi:AraC-like DNA-binding protein